MMTHPHVKSLRGGEPRTRSQNPSWGFELYLEDRRLPGHPPCLPACQPAHRKSGASSEEKRLPGLPSSGPGIIASQGGGGPGAAAETTRRRRGEAVLPVYMQESAALPDYLAYTAEPLGGLLGAGPREARSTRWSGRRRSPFSRPSAPLRSTCREGWAR